MPTCLAIAGICSMEFVEPPVAIMYTMAFMKFALRIKSLGFLSAFTALTITLAASTAICFQAAVWLLTLALPFGENPRISASAHMVLAVPIKGQAPGVGQACLTMSL